MKKQIIAIGGAALLIGPVRRWCGQAFHRAVHTREDRSVVDLAPGEWRQLPDQDARRPRPKDNDRIDGRL